MKVLFVASDFNRSGAALAMIELAQNIQALGNDVILSFPGYGDAVVEARKRKLRCIVIRSYEWVKPTGRKESIPIKLKWALKHIYNCFPIIKTAYLMKKEGVEIVHNNTLWGYVGPLSALFAKKPVVWHMRELLSQQRIKIRWERPGIKLINKSKALIAISKIVKDNYSSWFDSDKIRLVYDGVEIKKFYNCDHDLLNNNTINAVIVGGVREHKRQIDAIRAFSIIQGKRKDIKLYIVGDDNTEYASELKTMVKEYGLEETVYFVGTSANTEKYYSKADIAITASEFEAFGRVTVEAMLSGCITIVSDSGANREIVEDGVTGYVYEAKNVEMLANTILNVIEHPDRSRKVAEAGQRYAKDQFGDLENAKRIMGIYTEVLNKC